MNRVADCPTEDQLRLLLARQTNPKESRRLMTHAAGCRRCGFFLRETGRDLTAPPTQEEEELASQSPLVDPLARRAFAVQLAAMNRNPNPKDRVSSWRFAWAVAPVGLAAAALLVAYPTWAHSPAHTRALLAKAYTLDRQMRPRLSDAEWAPEQTRLGKAGSSIDKPQQLSDAEANIRRGLTGNPEEPRWLQLQGDADILENNLDAAIGELERAQSLAPNSASILTDLGTALLQKSEIRDVPELRNRALEHYAESYKLNSRDPALLYNRAWAAEQANLYHEAEDYWNEYLRVDSTSRWAQDAREHLASVKKNLSARPATPAAQPPQR